MNKPFYLEAVKPGDKIEVRYGNNYVLRSFIGLTLDGRVVYENSNEVSVYACKKEDVRMVPKKVTWYRRLYRDGYGNPCYSISKYEKSLSHTTTVVPWLSPIEPFELEE